MDEALPVSLVPEPLRVAHLYLVSLDEEAKQKKSRESHRDFLKSFIMGSFEPDEEGNFFYEFPEPINLGDYLCRGLKAQRRTSEWINDDKAREIIAAHGLEDRCLKEVTETYIDYDALYAANQEGIIPDEEIDTVLEISESYALVKVKA